MWFIIWHVPKSLSFIKYLPHVVNLFFCSNHHIIFYEFSTFPVYVNYFRDNTRFRKFLDCLYFITLVCSYTLAVFLCKEKWWGNWSMQIMVMYLSHHLMIRRAHLLWNSFFSLFCDPIVVLNYVAYFERKKYEIERWSVRKITGKVEHYRSLMMPNRLLPFPIQIAIAIYFLTRDNWIVC